MLTAEERYLATCHEAGDTAIALLVPGLDPVHEVTIVPREDSLDVVTALPERNRYPHAFSDLRTLPITLLSGRAAEEVILGVGQVTTETGERRWNRARGPGRMRLETR